MRASRIVVACLAVILAARPALAQGVHLDSVSIGDTTVRHSVRLRDGSNLIGRITRVTADSVLIALASGTVAVSRGAVAQVRQFEATRLRNGEYWFENPHATRLLFSSTAFPLEKGTGYYSNTWLFLHTFATGITDRFTLGGGGTLVPGIDFSDNIFYLLPKYTLVDEPGAKFALGALVGLLPFGVDGGDGVPWTAGILYGVGTAGNRDSNLSLGLGWGYAGDQLATQPIVMLGGQGRVSRRVSLISENWFFPVDRGTEGLLSYGLRFLGEGLTVDLAWLTPMGGGVVGVPWLGFAFRF